MKLVTFSRPMSPHGVGDTRLVTDDVAEQLRKDGAISAAETFPPAAAPSRAPLAPEKPKRAVLKPSRPTGTLDLRLAE